MIWNRFLRLLGRGDTGGTVPPPPPAREVLAFPTPGAPAWGVAMTDRRMLALHDAIDRHRGRVAALPIPSREAFERYSRKISRKSGFHCGTGCNRSRSRPL
jgi:hypothetical protein